MEEAAGDMVCLESDGCPTENAVLKREWRKLRQQLAEYQAREKATPKSNYEKGVFNPVFEMPSDSATIDAMLKQAEELK